MKLFASLLVIGSVAAAAHIDLQAKYPFRVVLYDQNNQYYGLHWNFTKETQSIYFAVNVSTTGWVGFGLSPNGQMPASDVVIGWINGGQTYFHDRFAEGRRLPSIDPSQDWFLLNSEEENGFTVLEFSRNFTTCDDRDLDITSSSDRVVWSFSLTDPSDPSGSDAMVHNYKGSRTINLIGGDPNVDVTSLEGEPFFEAIASNVTIPPNSTTYWCQSFRLPPALINTTHFVNRISPSISPQSFSYVHHMVAFNCPTPLGDNHVGLSAPCYDEDVLRACTGGLVLAAWAVGGEDFVYPNGIAYPVGGIGQEQFVVLQLHYDNPNNDVGVVDNSGLRFYYTLEEPVHRAGGLSIGHAVNPAMIVPPHSRNYTIAAVCTASCTKKFLPEEGIRVFGDFLHTHLAGRGLVLQHFRWNSECNVLEELEPINQNMNYDFNFQQYTHLKKEYLILPGDILVLKCYYNTTDRNFVTYGGLSTREEMCISFPLYYPRSPNALANCGSISLSGSFTDFYLYLARTNPSAAQLFLTNPGQALTDLNWEGNPQLATTLQNSILNSKVAGYCRTENGRFLTTNVSLPTTKCPYEAPNKCRSSQPENCCARVGTAAAIPQTEINLAIGVFLLVLSFFMAM